MTPEIVDLHQARLITGLAVRTSNERERDPDKGELPRLWARFMAADQEKHGGSRAITSVYTEYESDLHGAYTVILGREGPPSAAGDRTVRISEGRYAVFTSTGEMPIA